MTEKTRTTAGIGQIDVEVSIEMGRKRLPINTLLDWTEGSLLELDRLQDQPVDILVDGAPFAKGEVVTVGENYGVRVLSLLNDDS
jgi:flagellar motor switch protein FliN/FliY